MKLRKEGLKAAFHHGWETMGNGVFSGEEGEEWLAEVIKTYLKATNSVIVPVEPTPEMISAWYRHKDGFHFVGEELPRDTSDYGAYRAMIQASQESQE